MKSFVHFASNFLAVAVVTITTLSTVSAQVAANNSQEAQAVGSAAESQENVGMELEAQNDDLYTVYDKDSPEEILKINVPYKKTYWIEQYLNEPANQPFMPSKKELTKFILDGVKEGAIVPYADDQFATRMADEEFLKQLMLPKDEGTSEEDKAFSQDASWGKPAQAKDASRKQDNEEAGEFFMPQELIILGFKVNWLFLSNVAKWYPDIISVSLTIPGNKFPTGLRRTIANFKYKEVAAYLDKKPEAQWINEENTAANIPFTKAIRAEWFSDKSLIPYGNGLITKVENPKDQALEDLYNQTPQSPLYASEQEWEKICKLVASVYEY